MVIKHKQNAFLLVYQAGQLSHLQFSVSYILATLGNRY